LSCILFFTAFFAFAEKAVSLGEYSGGIRREVVSQLEKALGSTNRVVRVTGTVTYANGRIFFIQRDEDGLKVIAEGRKKPSVGDEVTFVGRPSLEGGRVVFIASEWTKLREGAIPAARTVRLEEIVSSRGGTGDRNALRVVLTGRVISRTEMGFAMNVEGIPVSVMLSQLPRWMENEEYRPLVRVTGVLEAVLDQSALLGREDSVIGVKLNVVSADDLEVVEDEVFREARQQRFKAILMAILIVALTLGLLFALVFVMRQRRGLFRTRTIMTERKRMADDLHDTIEQHLVGAGMLLKLNRIKEAQDVLVRAKREIRDIVWGLKNDDMMRLSPADMLRELAHQETAKGIYRVDTLLAGLPSEMDAAQTRDLSLIVREAIGNAVKHGGATKIAISADALENGGWLLRVANDGKVFDPASAPGVDQGHFGFEGMRERARRLGATLSIAEESGRMVLRLEKLK